MRINFDIVN